MAFKNLWSAGRKSLLIIYSTIRGAGGSFADKTVRIFCTVLPAWYYTRTPYDVYTYLSMGFTFEPFLPIIIIIYTETLVCTYIYQRRV